MMRSSVQAFLLEKLRLGLIHFRSYLNNTHRPLNVGVFKEFFLYTFQIWMIYFESLLVLFEEQNGGETFAGLAPTLELFSASV